MARVRSPKRRVRDDDFVFGCGRISSDYRRIIVGIWSNRLYIGGNNSGSFRWHLELRISWQAQYLVMLHGNQCCSAHCKWRSISDADQAWYSFCGAGSGSFRWHLELRISWQAQYLVMLHGNQCCSAHCKWRSISAADQSWDAFCVAGAVFGAVGVWLFVAAAVFHEVGVLHFVAGAAVREIWIDSRSVKCCIFQYKMPVQDGTGKVSEAAGARWRFCVRMWSDIVGLSSESGRIVFILAETIQGVSADILNSEFRGRRSIWWCCMVTSVAPRIVNDVPEVTRIKHDIHFVGQAQYLVQLDCDSCCSAHCKWRFISVADQSWDAFCVAGAVFGAVGVWLFVAAAVFHEVGVLHFVAGAAVREIWIDSRSVKCCIFQYKMPVQDGTGKVSEAAGARWRFCVRMSSDVVGYRRIIVGIWSNRLYIGGNNSGSFRWHLELRISWQAQYLVMLHGNQCCSAHCKWRSISAADQSWDAFCVAGAVFGAVGLWLLLLRAL